MTTKIEWTDETWSPVTGCTKISPGCANCYAERMARRLAGHYGYPEPPHHFDVVLRPDRLEQPLRWKRPRMVFVCSMSDLFHKDVPDGFIGQVFEIMRRASQHTFQILTKRPKRMLEFQRWWFEGWAGDYLPNVWLGVTAESQQAADERIPLLLQTPAAVRFVSCEPLLGPIDLGLVDEKGGPNDFARLSGLDWVIVGGESGPGARPMRPDWARSLRDQCRAAGISFFFKQMAERKPIPHDLMIREFPDHEAVIGSGFRGDRWKAALPLFDLT